MITISKYQIPKFEEIRNSYDFKDKVELKYASYIACLYYEFAYYRMLGFSDVRDKFFKENPSDHNVIYTYLNQSWSEAYSIYALLRTSIEAIRKINKGLLNENQIDSYYKTKIKEIVDITNDIIKHPMFNDPTNPADASQAYRPISLYIDGLIDIERWIDQTTPSSTLTINPMKDFDAMHNYLEYIADLIQTIVITKIV
jgi:hypothetical protein